MFVYALKRFGVAILVAITVSLVTFTMLRAVGRSGGSAGG